MASLLSTTLGPADAARDSSPVSFHPPASRGRRISYHASILALALALLAAAVTLNVEGESHISLHGLTLPELCVWRQLLGISCPGCGLTRSCVSVAHGEIGHAWHFHPAGLFVVALAAAQLPYRAWQLWRTALGQAEVLPNAIRLATWGLVAALVASWLWHLIAWAAALGAGT
jgi:hypothetical protein